MGFISQLLGAIMGAAAGFGLGKMMVFGVGGETTNLSYVLAGVGMLAGFMIGRYFANRYEAESEEGNSEAS